MTDNNDELIGKIYETALSPGDWVELLDTIASWTEGASDAPSTELASRSQARSPEDHAQVMHTMYSSMPWPVLMLDANIRMLESKPVAQQVLAERPVRRLGDGPLRFADRELKQDLARANNLAAGRDIQLLTSPQDGISLLGLPIRKSDALGPAAHIRSIVWVLAGHSVVAPSAESLRSLFSITAAESRLLHLLCKIGNLLQRAQLLNIKISTARSHVKTIMSTLNARLQVQLLSHAMGHPLVQAAHLPKMAEEEAHTLVLPAGRVLSGYD